MNQTAEMTTILIADDDPSHLMLAEAALAGAGFLVHTAADGEEAVQQFAVVKPDCVVLDVMMPKLTGHRGLPPDPRAGRQPASCRS